MQGYKSLIVYIRAPTIGCTCIRSNQAVRYAWQIFYDFFLECLGIDGLLKMRQMVKIGPPQTVIALEKK
jgi:hypothetical protein